MNYFSVTQKSLLIPYVKKIEPNDILWVCYESLERLLGHAVCTCGCMALAASQLKKKNILEIYIYTY